MTADPHPLVICLKGTTPYPDILRGSFLRKAMSF